MQTSSQSNYSERSEYAIESYKLQLASCDVLNTTEFKGGNPIWYKADSKRRDSLLIHGVRQNLDLVALICYWKLKQKYPVGEHCFARKLSELVYLGTTTIPGRVKGKRRSQIKIPTCGAFRGSSALEKQDVQPDLNSGSNIRLDVNYSTPCCLESSAITIELRPLSANTWSRVQALSLNPRIRLQLSSSKNISTVTKFLNSRFSISDPSEITIHIISTEICDTGSCICKEASLPMNAVTSSDTESLNCLGISCDCLLSEIGSKMDCSVGFQLYYQIYDRKDRVIGVDCLLHLVSFLRSSKPLQQNTISPNIARRYSSPTLKNYIRSLPKTTSPLSKYRNKYQSPKKLNVRFDSSKDTSKSNVRLNRIQHNRTQKTSLPAHPSIVSSLGPMKTSKKTRNKLVCGNYLRQLVPKPLPFLPEQKLPDQKSVHYKELNVPPSSGGPVVTDAFQTEKQKDIIEEDIQGAVVQNFLSEKRVDAGTGSELFSSSDTVNELLHGLACDKQEQEILDLSRATCQVLPSFSKVLDQSISTQKDLQSEKSYDSNLTENCRIVWDDASNDYIAKFKELATNMEKEAS